jgi:antitoxin (DNA-binding transcriptional repressor) of toxin-antitoxin stability system
MTLTVGVRQLEDSLSRYLRQVRSGESVVILDGGQAVAILSPIPDGRTAVATAVHLASLAARCLITLGTGRKRRARRPLPRVHLSGAVADDRSDRG